MPWELITNIILISAIAILAVFTGLGLYQWVSRKSLRKVDRELLWLPLPLALMVATYFIFDKIFILNTRPDGSGEPSFPSTHVMVVATIFLSLIFIIPKYVKSTPARIAIYILMVALIALVSVGRILANKHWGSDVVGASVFAAFFSLIYYLIIRRISHVSKS